MEMRREHRIFHGAKMRLKSADRDDSVIARVQNLSPLGVFVTAPAADLPEPGTEVECGFSFAGEPRTVRGRVAWRRPVSPAAPLNSPGVGIEFLDIADRDAAILRRMVARRSAETQLVDVWFEGMDTSTRCQATAAGAGLRLATRLPFMRVHSTVRLSLAEQPGAELRYGAIESVSVDQGGDDGVPRLYIGVSLPPVDTARGTIEIPPARTAPPAPDGEQSSTVVDPELFVAPAVSSPAAADPTPRGLAAADWSAAEPTTVSPPPAADLPPPSPPAASGDRRGAGGWRQAALGCLAGALLVGLGTLRPWRHTPSPRPEPAPAPGAATPPVRPPAAPKIEPLPASALALEVDGRTSRLRVPLSGRTRGLQQKRLNDPAGLAVTFPFARPQLSPGTYTAANGPLRLEVQRRAAGSELRFLYDPRTLAATAAITVEGDALLFELKARN